MDTPGKTFTAKLIPVDPDVEITEIQIGASLRELQGAIGGGHIECVRTSQGMMIVDEEGLLKGLPQNIRAGRLYAGPTGIAGPALLFTYPEWEAIDQEHA